MRSANRDVAPRVFVIACGVLFSVVGAPAQTTTHPDFSGAWVFDQAATVARRGSGQPIVAAMFGDEFTARQDQRALSLDITSGTLRVRAVYNLDGSESMNVSPAGPGQAGIETTSRASWDNDRLVIVTRSTSVVDGKPVPVESRRVMWLDPDGDLILDRTGTPPNLVPSTRSIYLRKSVEPSRSGQLIRPLWRLYARWK